jgi:hypothetical protein
MPLKRLTFIFSVLAVFLTVRPATGETLDNAPFRVVLPDREWQIDISTAQPMGKNTSIAATISNANTQLKSLVLKAVFRKNTDSILDELCSGMRDSFSNPAVKMISERDTTFLEKKAKIFVYHVTLDGKTTYNEATVFVADNVGWTIACIGRPDQRQEVRAIIGFFQKKSG